MKKQIKAIIKEHFCRNLKTKVHVQKLEFVPTRGRYEAYVHVERSTGEDKMFGTDEYIVAMTLDGKRIQHIGFQRYKKVE